MTKKRWYLYGILFKLDLATVLFLVILVLTNRLNLVTVSVLIFAQFGLCLIAIKARLPILRVHRLLGMAQTDIFYAYLKCHFIALLMPCYIALLSYPLEFLTVNRIMAIVCSLYSMYLLSGLSTYWLLRRNL
ncbi:hypothetical protein [Streptococcus sp. CSL10205-OR2]|uniref:hypothetical protein n=1 Tax=Streptococcus sp. CSL10205-OR2 TaxID=2980558 RepID=UPI0021DB6A73|nr:hypothetical protein [Streptococcus sp. CSL10205-OR2]MCU9534180.1 hypothetical protein [Streptococcus sp. CSL10205-OR2]